MAKKGGIESLPHLSNDAQLEVMELVKKGMSLTEALQHAEKLGAEEARSRAVCQRLSIIACTVYCK